jgi:3-hydroxyacyl-CoA dehydrogenase / enoyl-CoA hydratase / 3-hydroxybutyryl-CoA epimerase
VDLHCRDDGVALVSLHPRAGRPSHLTPALLAALDRALARLEEGVREGRVRAVVVRSARPGTFLAGVDLEELLRLPDAGTATREARAGQRVLRRLELLEVPTVAAVDGECLGSGMELALACGYRFASSARHTRLGLPHVRIGITPAFGGTVRLPRLIGLQAALDLILSGRAVSPEEAHGLGLVDEVVEPLALDDLTIEFALERARHGRLRRRGRRAIPRRLLEETAPGRRLVFRRASARVRESDADHTPAARRALEMVMESVNLPLERAFEHEAEVAGELLVSPAARALASAALAGRAGVPAAAEAPRTAAVLGAGEMGIELTFSLISAGVETRMRDRRREALAVGVRHVLSRIAEVRLADRITEEEADRRGALLSSGTGYGGFGALDLVLAAEGDGEEWARAALREVADHVDERCILAFSSPLIAPAGLQEEIARPERLLGFHPALPADRFPLLEIAPAPATHAVCVGAAAALARRMARRPLRVAFATATPLTRLLGVYFDEALRLLEEGAGITAVDRAAESFGLLMGPLRRMDSMGIARAGRYLAHLAAHDSTRFHDASATLARVLGAGGFYTRGRRGAVPNPDLPEGAGEITPERLEATRDRLLLRLLNEAALILQDGAVAEPREIEILALLGIGFPRLRGGLLFHAEATGLDATLAALHRKAEWFGARFLPVPLLVQAAGAGRLSGLRTAGHPAGAVL